MLRVSVISAFGLCLSGVAPPTSLAQALSPPSATYLFTSNVEDVRAAWINPAGLGVLPIASLYAEVGTDRSTDSWEVRQYSFGISSRGAALGYQRDRFPTGNSNGTWRVGMALPLARRMAVGASLSFYHPDRGADIGFRYSPLLPLDLGLVVRNLGRPDSLPVTVAMGATWRSASRLAISGDVIAAENRPLGGYTRTYHLGGELTLPARTPIGVLTAIDFGSGLGLPRWSLGVALGLQNQLLAVGSTPPGDVSARLESLNFAGVARGQSKR